MFTVWGVNWLSVLNSHWRQDYAEMARKAARIAQETRKANG